MEKAGKIQWHELTEKPDNIKPKEKYYYSAYYYVDIHTINPKIYNFLKNNYDVLQKRYRLHEAIGFKL